MTWLPVCQFVRAYHHCIFGRHHWRYYLLQCTCRIFAWSSCRLIQCKRYDWVRIHSWICGLLWLANWQLSKCCDLSLAQNARAAMGEQYAEFAGKRRSEAPFSLMLPKSHCLKCGHQIRWYENIPILSYLFLRQMSGLLERQNHALSMVGCWLEFCLQFAYGNGDLRLKVLHGADSVPPLLRWR